MVRHSTEPAFEEQLERAEQLLASDAAGALKRAQKLAAEQPDARAFRLAANALRTLGRDEEAADHEIQAIKFGFTPPLRQAVAAREAGRNADSRMIAAEYLRRYPDDLLAKTIAAEAALNLQDARLAENLLGEVRARAPAFPRAAVLLAQCLAAQFRFREAIAVMEDLHRRLPDDPAATRYLAELRAQTGNPVAAGELYAEVVSRSPAPEDLYRYAQSMRAAGRKQESIDALRRAIELQPTSGRAWWAIAQYFPEELDHRDVEQVRAIIARLGADAGESLRLRIALSIVYHRRNEFKASFEEIAAVKAARRPAPPYNADALSAHVDELIAAYAKDFPPRSASRQTAGDTPIFIVGMPRSGSTLVERIIGQHSKIEPIGEVRIMARMIAAESPPGETGYRSLLPASMSPKKVGELAARYLQQSLEFRRTDKRFFTDKYNANWIRTGLILQMFPDAKVLDVRRGALDCCWSVYKMMFGDDYANDQRDLARYYADYVRFMDAMRAAAPDNVLLVDYESLVDDVEGETHRMLHFIGVDDEPGCTDFHLSGAPVATPSSEQVRRPLFRDGIGSAEPYRQWLGDLIDELEARGMKAGRP